MTNELIQIKKKLTELKKDSRGIVISLLHKDSHKRQKLNAMGIHKGTRVIRKNSSYPIVIDADGVEMVLGKELAQDILLMTDQKTIFLLGNPNVGKSTLFSRITGVKTDASNYPGTTVALLSGEAKINKNFYTVYDLPGIYSLEEDCKAGQEACFLLKNKPYDIALYVIDSQHLERNLFFALDVIALGKPTVVLLNKYDAAQKKGVDIDAVSLSQMLGVPVVKINGLTGKGLEEAAAIIDKIVSGKIKYKAPQIPEDNDEKWKFIGKISSLAQHIYRRKPSLLEKTEDLATNSILALPLALLALAASVLAVLYCGGFIMNLLTPLYENYYLPFMQNIFGFARDTFAWNILFGSASQSLAQGQFGLLSDAVKIAFIDVMPYVFAFYAVLEFLSDLGYLPRIAVLLDKMLHKLGLHGYSAIPLLLGLGCKVPAVMAVRMLETQRQKIIALVLILIMAPCISQTAIMVSVVAPYGLKYLFAVFAVMFITGVICGTLLNKILPGDTTDVFMEIPSWQMPRPLTLARKINARLKEYIKEAVPFIMLGILITSLAQAAGLLTLIANIFQWPVKHLLGLPPESVSAVILGFLRKDVSIALLAPFGLSAKQMIVACVFMAMYLPCVASFFVIIKENGFKNTVKIAALTFCAAVFAGAVLNFIL